MDPQTTNASPMRSRLARALGLGAILALLAGLLFPHLVPGFPLDGADESESMQSCRRVALGDGLELRPGDPYEFVGLNWIEGRDGAYHGKHPFGWPVLCAAAYRIAGPTAPFWLSPLLAMVAVAGMAGFGWRIGGPWGGLLAAAIWATNPVHVGYGLTVMTHSAALAFSILGLWAAWRFAEGAGAGAAIAAGLLCGAAVLTRYGSAMVALPVAVAIGLRLQRAVVDEAGWRSALPAIALLVGAGALAALPLLAYNAAAYGSPFVTGQAITESSGLGLQYWGRNFAFLGAQLAASGLWVLFAVGIAGLALLARRRPGLAAFLAAWAAGHFALYHSFYWRSGGHWAADLRYYVDVFPPLVLAAVAGVAALPQRARTPALLALAVALVPMGAVRSLETARLSRSSNQGSLRIGSLVAETVPNGAVVLTDENIVHALPYYGDWTLYHDAMFHPSYLESYTWLLEDDRPWPVSRRRVRRWVEILGGRSTGELAALERELVADHLSDGRRAFFVTGGNHRNEWRERLGVAFRIETVALRRLYWDEADPRFPSRQLAIYELLPLGDGSPGSP